MQIRTRPIEQRDLAEADRIMRLAFGTFLGLPDPMTISGDSDYAYTRFRAAPDSALAAEAAINLVGSNFVTNNEPYVTLSQLYSRVDATLGYPCRQGRGRIKEEKPTVANATP
jgi:hypothetical protein